MNWSGFLVSGFLLKVEENSECGNLQSEMMDSGGQGQPDQVMSCRDKWHIGVTSAVHLASYGF